MVAKVIVQSLKAYISLAEECSMSPRTHVEHHRNSYSSRSMRSTGSDIYRSTCTNLDISQIGTKLSIFLDC